VTSEKAQAGERLVHINAGSLILRQLFQRLPSAQDTAEVLGRGEDRPV
jgi:hypothetical protein